MSRARAHTDPPEELWKQHLGYLLGAFRTAAAVARTLRAIAAADALHTRALPPSLRRP